MYIALILIIVGFTITTNGLFISSQNISKLIDQTGYIAVLAVGMTLVIVIRHIDLSVGFLAGFLGAIAALMLSIYKVPVYIVLPAILIIGVALGFYNGILVAKLDIPSFVSSLSGMMIFRGALLFVTQSTGTIVTVDPFFNAIGNGFIPEVAKIGGFHALTLVIGALSIVLFIWSEIKNRNNKKKYNFEVTSDGIFILKLMNNIIGNCIYNINICCLQRAFLDNCGCHNCC